MSGTIVTRRGFIAMAASTLLRAPAVVRSTSLMSLRGILLASPPPLNYFGYCDRLYVSGHLPHIQRLQERGLSLVEAAAEMNRAGSTAMNGHPWNPERVLGIVRRDRLMRRADAYVRMQRETSDC